VKKAIIILLVLAVAGAGAFLFVRGRSAKKKVHYTEVSVKRGDLTEKALAVGTINPDHEIVIKSQISGTVAKISREVGEQVTRGEPLMEVKPEPTPIEVAEAQRQYELADLDKKYLETDLKRTAALYENDYVSGRDYEAAQKLVRESDLRASQAQERLELLKNGSSKIGDLYVDSVIRAPTTGTILQCMVNVGDPVVPLTSYQPGTELIRMASMDDLIFVGTVDEIDVGKIKTGMKAVIHIGAQQSQNLDGELVFISPKSRLKENVVVFDIKIRLTDTKGVTLRAGYSASADLIVNEKKDVLQIPERVVEFKGDSTFVKMKVAVGDSLARHPVLLGVSDGFSVEVVGGLSEGDKVIDK
jgi:HlyD family secretion protein